MAQDNGIYDLVVIGGGPAGYAAAIRAGQLGRKVACVEMERPGGTCLNWGCIPSKALLKSAEAYHLIKNAGELGFTVENVSADYAKVIERSRSVAGQMAKGIEFLFKKNKVEHLKGKGHVPEAGKVEVTEGADKGKVLQAKNILLSPGCRSRRLPEVAVDGRTVMTSREILELKEMPRSITILGAGAIGVEFAYFLNAFGCEVHLVEMLERIVPVEDEEVSEALRRAFKKAGIKIYTGVKAGNVKPGEGKVTLDLKPTGEKGKESTLETEALLVAIGVEARLEGLFAEGLEIEVERGHLVVDERYQTGTPGIYAAGDVIGPPWLAHVATFEAIQAVNGMFEKDFKPHKVDRFPGCTYCMPQIASIGLTEAKAKEQGLDYRVGKFPFSASGKAVASNHPEGFVKLITERETGELLGAHIIGAEATELISEYALGMKLEATWEEIHGTIHPHPTMSEALMEAAAATNNEAIHI